MEYCFFVKEKVEVKRGPYPARMVYCGMVDDNKCLVTGEKCGEVYGAIPMGRLYKSYVLDEGCVIPVYRRG